MDIKTHTHTFNISVYVNGVSLIFMTVVVYCQLNAFSCAYALDYNDIIKYTGVAQAIISHCTDCITLYQKDSILFIIYFILTKKFWNYKVSKIWNFQLT